MTDCQLARNIDLPSASNSDPPLAIQGKLTWMGQSWVPITAASGPLSEADSHKLQNRSEHKEQDNKGHCIEEYEMRTQSGGEENGSSQCPVKLIGR